MFITLEGPDGSGKTTVSKAIVEKLEQEGYPVLYSREPGGSKIAEEIREVILNPENTLMDVRTEALLYAASRRQHLQEKVLPALKEGKIVICDRFVDSSLAYQGYARGIGIDEVYQINLFAIEDHLPDMTIYLDISAEEGLRRIHQGREYLDRLDQEGIAFHHAVHEGYEKVLERFKERMQVIDASQQVEEVIKETYQKIKEFIDGRR